MTRVLAAIVLLASINSHAESIEITKSSDVCLSGVCIGDDVSKYPSIYKEMAKGLKDLNRADSCKLYSDSGFKIETSSYNIMKNNNKLSLFFRPYINNGKLSAGVSSIIYNNDKANLNAMNDIFKEYTAKYTNIHADGGSFMWSETQRSTVVFHAPELRMGAFFKVHYFKSKDESQPAFDEYFAAKPICNAKPKL